MESNEETAAVSVASLLFKKDKEQRKRSVWLGRETEKSLGLGGELI